MDISVHPIELELAQAVNLKTPDNRSENYMALFRNTLATAVDRLREEVFNELSDAAKKWQDYAVEAIDAGDFPPDFSIVDGLLVPSAEEAASNVETAEPAVSDVPEVLAAVETTPVKPAASAESAPEPSKTDPAEPSVVEVPVAAETSDASAKKAAPTKTRKRRAKPAGVRVKELMLEHGADVDEYLLLNHLRSENYRLSVSTLSVIRYEFKQTLRLLKSLGYLNKEFKDI